MIQNSGAAYHNSLETHNIIKTAVRWRAQGSAISTSSDRFVCKGGVPPKPEERDSVEYMSQ